MSGTLTERKYRECTPREWWIQECFGKQRCDSCGDRPIAMRAHVALPASHLRAVDPVGMATGRYGDAILFKKGLASEPYHYYEERAACAKCQKAMEVHLAHAYKDSAYVSFDVPPPEKLIVLATA